MDSQPAPRTATYQPPTGLDAYRGHVTTRLIVAVIVILMLLMSKLIDSLTIHILSLALSSFAAVYTGCFMVGGLRRFGEASSSAAARPAIRFARLVLIGSLIADIAVSLIILAVLPFFIDALEDLDFLIKTVSWLLPHFDDIVVWSAALGCAHYVVVLLASRRISLEAGRRDEKARTELLVLAVIGVAVAQVMPFRLAGQVVNLYTLTTAVALAVVLGFYVGHLRRLSEARFEKPGPAPLPESRLVR